MKKLKLQALSLGANETLSRTQLKNVLGGGTLYQTTTTNPNCNGTTATDWYCCKGGVWTHLANQDCNTASGNCQGGSITNDGTKKDTCSVS